MKIIGFIIVISVIICGFLHGIVMAIREDTGKKDDLGRRCPSSLLIDEITD